MSSDHSVSIATADRDGSRRDGAERVSIPAHELVASNGLVTGQSGADPAASVEHVAESLVAAGETVVVIDPGGDFASLADAGALRVGGDPTCDVKARPDAVDRVASLALDGARSIVLDLDSLDGDAVDGLLGSLTDALIDSRRDGHRDLLLIVDDCHRWLATDGPTTHTGENLVELGGPRHGDVGILGLTDQPSNLRRDVLTGVDWLLAHRLTWREDVRAMTDLLDEEYVDALEDLDEDEAFLNAGWQRGVQRVRFGDAPTATADPTDEAHPTRSPPEQPGENAHGQPDVGAGGQSGDDDGQSADDLLAGLAEATPPADGDRDEGDPERDEGESSIRIRDERDEDVAKLRDEVATLENRIASLEAKLDAREDVEELADRIAAAITEGLEDVTIAGAATGAARPAGDAGDGDAAGSSTDSSGAGSHACSGGRDDADGRAEGSTDDASDDEGPSGFGDVFGMFDDAEGPASSEAGDADSTTADGGAAYESTSGESSRADADRPSDRSAGRSSNGAGHASGNGDVGDNGNDGGMSFQPMDFGVDEGGGDLDSTVPDDFEDDFGPPSRHGASGRTIPRYLRKIVRAIEEMDVTTRRMLAHYVEEGTASPMDAHYAAGGGSDRTRAYAHNRRLRTNGLVEHVGKGNYGPRLREYVVDEAGHSVPDHELDRAVDVIRQAVEQA